YQAPVFNRTARLRKRGRARWVFDGHAADLSRRVGRAAGNRRGKTADRIVTAARYLDKTADEFAKESELGGTIVGTVFVALVTSLPEISTTLAAVRMKAYDLAVGNILGSNAFNMAALIGVDLFYSGPLLSSVSETHAITAATVIIVTAVLIMGLLYRAEKRHWIIEPDAELVILLVVAAFAVVCWFGG
ncbi:MAG: hypothetical protein IID46_05760, partial [Planctomycetes bacterium]|nr:hypothetical protein [Planctomycetota bacterium]